MIKQIHLIECDSTQDILKEQLKDHRSPETLLVSCEKQISGRGRGNNQWEAMPGTICFSLSILPHKEPSFTALEMSLLVLKFFEEIGKDLFLKWPNDIWNKHQQKCCGVLIQNSHDRYMAGIGLNLFSNNPTLGAIFDSEFEFDKKSWSKEMAEFILAHRYIDTDTMKQDWQDRCFHMFKQVTITEGQEIYQGIFQGIGQHGEAILNTPAGEQRIYNGSLRLFVENFS